MSKNGKLYQDMITKSGFDLNCVKMISKYGFQKGMELPFGFIMISELSSHSNWCTADCNQKNFQHGSLGIIGNKKSPF